MWKAQTTTHNTSITMMSRRSTFFLAMAAHLLAACIHNRCFKISKCNTRVPATACSNSRRCYSKCRTLDEPRWRPRWRPMGTTRFNEEPTNRLNSPGPKPAVRVNKFRLSLLQRASSTILCFFVRSDSKHCSAGPWKELAPNTEHYIISISLVRPLYFHH
jgi:hypothetical protein